MKGKFFKYFTLFLFLLLGTGCQAEAGLITLEDQAAFEEAVSNDAFIFVTSKNCSDCKDFKQDLKQAISQEEVPVFEYVLEDFQAEDQHIDNMVLLEVMGTPTLLKVEGDRIIHFQIGEAWSVDKMQSFLESNK